MKVGITSVTSPNLHRQTNIHRYEEATLTWRCLHLSSHTLFAVDWWILKPPLGRPPAQLPPSWQTEWRRSGFVGGKGTVVVSMAAGFVTHAGGEAAHTLWTTPWSTGLWKADFYAHQVQASVAISGQRSRIKFPQLGYLCCCCVTPSLCSPNTSTGRCRCETNSQTCQNQFNFFIMIVFQSVFKVEEERL